MVVTGIPGVGKTTVLSELASLANQTRFKLTVLNFGTVMNDVMRQLGSDLHRDEMRKQNIELQKRVQELAAKEIADRATHAMVVVDTHMFIRTSTGMWAGLPQHVLTMLRPRLLVLIEADPEQIAMRRKGDSSRMREQALADDIAFDIEWSRATATVLAVLTGAPVKVIRNDVGRQREAAEELLKAIRSATEDQT